MVISKKAIFCFFLGGLMSMAVFSVFLYHSELPSCRANLVAIKRTDNMDYQVTSAVIDIITFDEKDGVIQLFGEVFENSERYRIIRRANFSYKKVDGIYLIHIERRDKSPLDEVRSNRVIPPFNMDEEVIVFEVSLMPGERSKYMFKQFGVPMFVCINGN